MIPSDDILLLLFFDPSNQFPGNERSTLCNTKKSTKIKLERTLLLVLLHKTVMQ